MTAKQACPLPPEALAVYFRLFNEIGILAQLSASRLERVMPYGLTVAQFSLLNHCVRLGDGWTPARLAAAFQVTRGTMTSTLKKLEMKGFVSLRPDTRDARSKRVFLTEDGRAASQAALASLIPDLSLMPQVLSEGEVLDILPALERLRVWLDASR